VSGWIHKVLVFDSKPDGRPRTPTATVFCWVIELHAFPCWDMQRAADDKETVFVYPSSEANG
jgi:hypothetical protein